MLRVVHTGEQVLGLKAEGSRQWKRVVGCSEQYVVVVDGGSDDWFRFIGKV